MAVVQRQLREMQGVRQRQLRVVQRQLQDEEALLRNARRVARMLERRAAGRDLRRRTDDLLLLWACTRRAQSVVLKQVSDVAWMPTAPPRHRRAATRSAGP